MDTAGAAAATQSDAVDGSGVSVDAAVACYLLLLTLMMVMVCSLDGAAAAVVLSRIHGQRVSIAQSIDHGLLMIRMEREGMQ